MYMDAHSYQLPLQSEDEVLVCTESTRQEEVTLFLRRALGMFKQGKLFCLLNADRLTYDVGVAFERFYEIESTKHNDNGNASQVLEEALRYIIFRLFSL